MRRLLEGRAPADRQAAPSPAEAEPQASPFQPHHRQEVGKITKTVGNDIVARVAAVGDRVAAVEPLAIGKASSPGGAFGSALDAAGAQHGSTDA